jgi:fumarate reductase subunit D
VAVLNHKNELLNFMAKTTKTLLVISIATLVLGLVFVTGIVNVQETVALYVVLPLGAVFLGLFLIFNMLEKESALYDEEHKLHPAPIKAAPALIQQRDDRSLPGHGQAHAKH